MPYQEDALVADDAATALLSTWKDPVSLGRKAEFLANGSDGLMTAAMLYEPGDKVAIIETVTGLSYSFFINAVEMILTKEQQWTVRWTLTPAGQLAFWILGVAGSSEMGRTTRVGY
jgi:hypothetical protein